MPVLLQYVPRRRLIRLCQMYIQSVVDAIALSGRHYWIAGFKQKYGIISYMLGPLCCRVFFSAIAHSYHCLGCEEALTVDTK
jgi:hypothetical protein